MTFTVLRVQVPPPTPFEMPKGALRGPFFVTEYPELVACLDIALQPGIFVLAVLHSGTHAHA